jgi:uncharacterized protein YjbI with pentapeptide repeats
MLFQEQSTQTDRYLPASRKVFGVNFQGFLKFVSSLLLPLALGVFTVVITYQQQDAAKQQRKEDQIASQLLREQERKLSDDRYQNEVFDNYVKDIATLLKETKGSLTSDEVRANIARAKTLTILYVLDAQRNTQVIRFLYDAKQLSETENHCSLDLSKAKLINFDFRDLAANEKQLDRLSLISIFLSNSTFLGIEIKYNKFFNTVFNNVSFSSSGLIYVDFSSARLFNAEFSYARLFNVIFSYTQLNYTKFSFAELENIDFTFANLTNIDFSYAHLQNVSFAFANITNIDFSYAHLQNVSFAFATIINIDFSYARLRKINFANSIILFCNFSSSLLFDIESAFAGFSSVKFLSTTLENVNFFNASFFFSNLSSVRLFDVKFSSALFYAVDFKSTQFNQVTFARARFAEVNFSHAILSNAHFSFLLRKKHFSFVFLVSLDFNHTIIANTSFESTTCVASYFNNAKIFDTVFIGANLKRSAFNKATLTNVNVSHANLYQVDFFLANITNLQLQNALSIEEARLPNGIRANDINLIRNAQTDCNILGVENWTLETGNVTTRMIDNQTNNCRFMLQSFTIGATMTQYINLSSKWDSNSWPNSQAVLSAKRSIGVSIELEGINNKSSAFAKEILSEYYFLSTNFGTLLFIASTKQSVALKLRADMWKLKVSIKFDKFANQNSETNYWCDDIKLLIIYGTYMEFRGKCIVTDY